MLYLIVLILSVHSVEAGTTTQTLIKTYVDRQDCEVDEGAMLTIAQNDPSVVGWIMPDECRALGTVPKKA